MNLLERLRILSNLQKKIIFWSIVILISSFLFFLWVKNTKEKIENFSKENLKEIIKSSDFSEFPKLNSSFNDFSENFNSMLKELEQVSNLENIENIEELDKINDNILNNEQQQ